MKQIHVCLHYIYLLCSWLEILIFLVPTVAESATMSRTVIASFDVILNTPLDVWQNNSGRKAARNRVMTVVQGDCQVHIGKVVARSSTHLQVDVKEPGDVDTIQLALKNVGSVTIVNREYLEERLEVDRAFKAQRIREENGLLTGSEVATSVLPALLKLWGNEGTDAQQARRGDALLEMMQTGQKAAAAAQSGRLGTKSHNGADDEQ